MSEAARYRLGFWLAVGAALGFSAKAIFVKLAYQVPGGVDAITLLALRMLFAAPLFAVATWRTASTQEVISMSRYQWMALVVVGLAGYYGASILDFWGLQFISAGLERLILFSYPSLTLLFGVAFFGQRFGRRELWALCLMYSGVVAAFAHDVHASADSTSVWIGAGLVLASSLSYAVYLVGSGELIGQLGSGRFTALAMGIATGATLLHYAIARPWADVLQQRWEIYALAAGMAVLSTAIPVFMQSAAIKYMGAGRASLTGMLGPVLTLIMGWTILGESSSWWQLSGVALVMLGVASISRR